MAWIEAHEELLDHPKTAHLGAAMGWNKYETVGRLFSFWWWCLKYAPTGNLLKFNDSVLGSAVVLNGDEATRFVKAMVEACWLDRRDGVFRIHDWPDYVKRYLKDSKFKGRSDKWQEVMDVYPNHGALEITLEKLQSNSEVSRGTNQPNQPTKYSANAGKKKTGRARAEEVALEVLAALPEASHAKSN